MYCFIMILINFLEAGFFSEKIKVLWRDQPYLLVTWSTIYWLLIILLLMCKWLYNHFPFISLRWVSPEQEPGLERLALHTAQHGQVWESHVCPVWRPSSQWPVQSELRISTLPTGPSHLLWTLYAFDTSSVHRKCFLIKNNLFLSICLFQEVCI